jgi:hypothetical protein
MAIVYFIFTVLLLIAAGILADNTRSYKVSGLCDSWKSVSGDIECNNLVVAVVSINNRPKGKNWKTRKKTL